MATEPLYTTHDIGKMLGFDPSSISKWISSGKIHGYATPGGHRRVRQSDLVAFLRANKIPVPTELGGEEASSKAALELSVLRDLLLLVGRTATIQQLQQWSPADRAGAMKWAVAAHLKASDNQVRLPPVPEIVLELPEAA